MVVLQLGNEILSRSRRMDFRLSVNRAQNYPSCYVENCLCVKEIILYHIVVLSYCFTPYNCKMAEEAIARDQETHNHHCHQVKTPGIGIKENASYHYYYDGHMSLFKSCNGEFHGKMQSFKVLMIYFRSRILIILFNTCGCSLLGTEAYNHINKPKFACDQHLIRQVRRFNRLKYVS